MVFITSLSTICAITVNQYYILVPEFTSYFDEKPLILSDSGFPTLMLKLLFFFLFFYSFIFFFHFYMGLNYCFFSLFLFISFFLPLIHGLESSKGVTCRCRWDNQGRRPTSPKSLPQWIYGIYSHENVHRGQIMII